MTTYNLGYDVLMWALGLLGTIITTVLLPLFVKWIQTKIKNEKLNYAFSELSETVITAVDYVQQTFVDQLKKDGKFDSEAQKEAMKKALNYAIVTITDTTKKIIESENIDLEALIEKYIESAILKSKTEK